MGSADGPSQRLEAGRAGYRVSQPLRRTLCSILGAVPLRALRQAGVRFDEVFAGNQEGVLAQLKARRVDAGAVNSRFLRQYEQREGVEFRKIFTSDGYPDLAVAVHPRVPPATARRVQQALLGMKDDPKAVPILARVKFSGFDPASERDYDGVRRVYRQIGQ